MAEPSFVASPADGPRLAFVQHLLGLVERESHGAWMAYHELCDRTIADLPRNSFVCHIEPVRRRRSVIPAALSDGLGAFPAIERFKEGPRQTDRVWFRARPAGPVLHFADTKAQLAAGFADWRAAMERGGVRRGRLWLLDGDRIAFANKTKHRRPHLDKGVELGVDPTGSDWTFQVNEPDKPADRDSGSTIAVDDRGNRYLLRQGDLHGNNQSELTRIKGPMFAERTGLVPVRLSDTGPAAARDWYVVCALDAPDKRLWAATSLFVERCHAARAWDQIDDAAKRQKRIERLLGKDEMGGTYIVGGRAAIGPKTVRRLQGEVYAALKARLDDRSIAAEKARHAAGYEVDIEIFAHGGALLVEIKTSNKAQDIYAGVGQLRLYPRMLDWLAEHKPVLLLPRSPGEVLVEAVEASGVAIHLYDLEERDGTVTVTFSADFLALCGLA